MCAAGERMVAVDCESGLCHVDSESGIGRCLRSLETCEPGSAHCDGDVAVSCSGGYVARTLCSPGQCRDTDGAFCSSEGTCESACDGEFLLACVAGGRRERIDCTQWGFTQCIESGSGSGCMITRR